MLDWIGLDWIGLDWIGLDWIGLDWIGLYCIVLYCIVLYCIVCESRQLRVSLSLSHLLVIQSTGQYRSVCGGFVFILTSPSVQL